MDKKQEDACIARARILGIEYVNQFWGCAQSTFAAVVDALREYGVEITSPEAEEALFATHVGMSGGNANQNYGNCGALTGALTAIGLAAGEPFYELKNNPDKMWTAVKVASDTVAKYFKENYGGYQCNDVRWNRFGKLWNSWMPEPKADFSKEENERGCLTPSACTISQTAGTCVRAILDFINNPVTSEQVKAEMDKIFNSDPYSRF